MQGNAAVRIAQQLFDKGDYTGVLGASNELLKDEATKKEAHLLFVKSMLLLLDIIPKEEYLEHIFSGAEELANCATSIEEYFDIEAEILQTVDDLTRKQMSKTFEWVKSKNDLEGNVIPFKVSLVYQELSIKLLSSMLDSNKIRQLKKEDPEKFDQFVKKRSCSRNEFSDAEMANSFYDAAKFVASKALQYVKDEGYSSSDYLQSIVKEMIQLFYLASNLYGSAIGHDGELPDDIRLKRLKEQESFIKTAKEQYIYPNGNKVQLIQGDAFSDDLKEIKKEIKFIKDKKEKIRLEKEKKRFDNYWNKHAQEKEKLEKEQRETGELISNLKPIIKDSEKKIEELQIAKKKDLPIEIECAQQQNLISDLEIQLSKCGIFKKKKRKEISERLSNFERPRYEELEKEAKKQRSDLNKEINAQIEAISKPLEAQQKELSRLETRLNEINTELTKPR